MSSLRTQLTIRLLLGGALLLGASGAALHWQVKRALSTEFNATLLVTGQSLVNLMEENSGDEDLGIDPGTMPDFERAKGPSVFLLRRADGPELGRSRSLGAESLPFPKSVPEDPGFFDTTFSDGRNLRCAVLRFNQNDEHEDGKNSRPHEVVLFVGRDRIPLDHTLATLRTALFLIGAISLAALAVLVRWGIGSGLFPLKQLGEAVSSVDASSLSTRLESESLPDELRPIAWRINELIARLEAAFSRERRFTANVAHELRTPLAELRAVAEVNLTTPSTPRERTESWQDTLATTLRMESLALRLLELTRLENPAQDIRRGPVLLTDALAEAWKRNVAVADDRKIELCVAVPPHFTCHTERELLGVVLENLCGNVAAHAPEGSPFVVKAMEANGTARILFSNPAGELTGKDVARLFERFWRKDSSRTDTGHHGLGLSIASDCADLLGGSLTAEIAITGDLEFCLQLPLHVDHTKKSNEGSPRQSNPD